jgi:hypothetical protein
LNVFSPVGKVQKQSGIETTRYQIQEEDIRIKADCCFGLMSVLLSVSLADAQATFTVFASGLDNARGLRFISGGVLGPVS